MTLQARQSWYSLFTLEEMLGFTGGECSGLGADCMPDDLSINKRWFRRC